MTDHAYLPVDELDDGPGIDWSGVAARLRPQWKSLAASALVAAATGVGITYLLPPLYSSATVILPPQSQGTSSAALASLSNLAALAGGGAKTSGDQYASMLQTVTVREHLIAKFKLLQAYDTRFHDKARKILDKRSRVLVGKKDGLILIEVDDNDPQRAADIANAYVDELRKLTSSLAVTEAQQRRVFFEAQMQETKMRLVKAQQELQASGFASGAIKVEPRTAAEAYAQLRAELTTAEVRLQTMQSTLSDSSPDIRRQQATINALRGQLDKLQRNDSDTGGDPDYVGKYREFKYEETLFDLLARQYELARVDEAREGTLIQVLDVAMPAEHRTFPSRLYFAVGGFVLGPLLLAIWLLWRSRRHARG